MRQIFWLALPALALAACDSGPSAPGDPDPGPGTIAITWQGGTVDWGAPAPLTAVFEGGSADDVVWRSLDDLYFGQPVILGRGPAITSAALRPGTTTVEASLEVDGVPIAGDSVEVAVRYRESWNLALEGHVPYPDGTVGDVWVDNGRAYVARRSAGGISIVGLEGGAAEIGRFTAEGLFTQDIHAADGIAYVPHEPRLAQGAAYPWSVTLVDAADPAQPVVRAGIPLDRAPTAHTVWLEGDLLTVAAPGTRFFLFDVSDPSVPQPRGSIGPLPSTAHDAHTRGGLFYGASMGFNGNVGRLTVATIADPSSPVVLAEAAFHTDALTHSCWLSPDGRFLYLTEENVNAPVRIYDVSSPASLRLAGTYQPRLGTVPHHFLVRDGRWAYLSHYKHGVEVVDVSDPATPRLVGFYDTHPGADEEPTGVSPAHDEGQDLYEGAWGVHWTDDGRVVVSDMHRGLFVFRFTGPQD
jgi:hypothetical protein